MSNILEYLTHPVISLTARSKDVKKLHRLYWEFTNRANMYTTAGGSTADQMHPIIESDYKRADIVRRRLEQLGASTQPLINTHRR